MSDQPPIAPIIAEGEPPICSLKCPQFDFTRDRGESHNTCKLHPATDCGEVCVPQVLRDQERLKAAEAVIAKLPHTADGVPVVPGVDTVWCGFLPGGVPLECLVRTSVEEQEHAVIRTPIVPKCYSTATALAEARKKEGA